MLFPIGDTQVEEGHKPYLSHLFIFINVAVFLYEVFLGNLGNQFVIQYGVIPSEIINGEDYFTLLTSIFLHGGWMHLIGNMLFLWIFGDNIEATIGSPRFLLFYIGGGIVASMFHIFFNPGSIIPSIGASGAIAAIMGAYLVMFPKSKIKVVFIIFFSTFEIPALLFLGIWFGQQLVSGIGSLTETTDTIGVAWWAHIGGFIFGLICGWWFRDNKIKIPPSRVKYVDNRNIYT